VFVLIEEWKNFWDINFLPFWFLYDHHMTTRTPPKWLLCNCIEALNLWGCAFHLNHVSKNSFDVYEPCFWWSHAMWRELSHFDWGQSLFKWGGGIKTIWIMNCNLIAFMKKVRINITIKRQYETLRKGEYWWKVQKMRIFSMVSLSSDLRKAQAFRLEHVSYRRHKGFWFYYLQQNPSPRIQEET